MARRPTLVIAALLAAVALFAAACAPPSPATGAREEPDRGGQEVPPIRVATRKAGPAWASGTVWVVMDDRFRYRPDSIRVRAGRKVTFAVTNVGKLPHEFILGDRATQLDHERQMQAAASGGGHAHGSGGHAATGAAGSLTVAPGQTERLTWTFEEPGIVLYGCHVLGHWAAGMKGTIVVVAPARPGPLAGPGR